ncbi:1-acyl-sn-glycerol-3-phosphate acyltransferase [Afifella sp. IM 167]|uniref:1-acyl-sn-glycerol-3-phosphate acyltransferase n=1 Tax=Afifella sp. IM 167 TaxID=2033586 RepID=UPI001CCE15FC|nr:1-acyl-sn-glycerol-3-phosphate acyltransferase [Afifella sp. IM 167]MBZ8135025.1 acyltransferase [Afifella sp. IM 167]
MAVSELSWMQRARQRALRSAVRQRRGHIVDQLIAERGIKLVANPFWPLYKPFLYRILRYREAVEMADRLGALSGVDGMDYISDLLSLNLQISGAERIPREGGFIIAANHPTGIADGVAVYQALKPVRGDVSIFTNRDAVRINERLVEYLIPVEWRVEHRSLTKTRETLRLSSRAFADRRAIVLFPAGRIAYWRNRRLNERPWQTSAVSLAQKHKVPVLPCRVTARNSWLFYLFGNQGLTELRDMTVFHELLNKRGKTFKIEFGPLISHEELQGNAAQLTESLQRYCVQTLADDPDIPFTAGAEAT